LKNRWAVAVAGTVVMICLGTVYSWSLFTEPLIAAFDWSNKTTTGTFSFTILFLGVDSIILSLRRRPARQMWQPATDGVSVSGTKTALSHCL